MGFLDNSTTTVDAILTTRGRELLSSGEGLNITKFALSDEEVDYTLFDVTHPNGTDSYGSVIENMNLLEAIPNRRTFNSFLVDIPLTGAGIVVSNLTNSNIAGGAVVPLSPIVSVLPVLFVIVFTFISLIYLPYWYLYLIITTPEPPARARELQ